MGWFSKDKVLLAVVEHLRQENRDLLQTLADQQALHASERKDLLDRLMSIQAPAAHAAVARATAPPREVKPTIPRRTFPLNPSEVINRLEPTPIQEGPEAS